MDNAPSIARRDPRTLTVSLEEKDLKDSVSRSYS